VELHKGALCGSPRNIVTALTTTMADVSAGKTANTHVYVQKVSKSLQEKLNPIGNVLSK
jgi:hypothetical protein